MKDNDKKISNLQKQLLNISYKLARLEEIKTKNKIKEETLKADAATKKVWLKGLIDKRETMKR